MRPAPQHPLAANSPARLHHRFEEHRRHRPRESQNLLALAAHQIAFHVGWIFKTESIIIPAFLDAIAGSGFLRGFLPVLNRVGQSLPPLFFSAPLKAAPRKRWALVGSTAVISAAFLGLAAIWFAVGGQRRPWLPAVFLAIYTGFVCVYGVYRLSFDTVQGKLIRPARRGRLLWSATAAGSVPAILLAWWLLDRWLTLPDGGFGHIFVFAGVCFAISGFLALGIFERPDHRSQPAEKMALHLAGAWRTLRQDRNLQRLILLATLFSAGQMIIPHYQALARKSLGLGGVHLTLWVVTQDASVAIFSLLAGPLADARGNRLTMRALIFATAVAPVFAISAASLDTQWGARLFWLVFIPLGLSPLLTRMVVNYTLELCPASEHPRYLSTLNLCLALPFFFSPLVGGLIDWAGFKSVFLAAGVLTAAGGCLTFGLVEPRHAVPVGPMEGG